MTILKTINILYTVESKIVSLNLNINKFSGLKMTISEDKYLGLFKGFMHTLIMQTNF